MSLQEINSDAINNTDIIKEIKIEEQKMDFTSIDPTVGAAMIEMASSLSVLALKGTATSIHSKIEKLKNERDLNRVRTAYDEMINQILDEREEAIRIAKLYKQELERVVISDEDIEYLQQTITRVLDIIKQFQPENDSIDTVESLKDLISKDVLKTMQLLGFNYKAAIGEPLTELCANRIRSLNKCSEVSNKKRK